MIITAMYIYGVSQQAWEFSGLYGLLTFIMDVVLVNAFSPSVRVVYESGKDEVDYWRKRTEVEELKRIKLDRELYGGK